MTRMLKLIADESGATTIEYAAIASLVSIVAITAIGAIGTQVNALLGGVVAGF
ncbi:MAG TPA: Flp family type IVb pilin [Sphingomicrobium sp.]|nr:Flp family type IVb pilin [Sphingomicrobium sp.]